MYTYMRVSAQLSPVWWALLKMLFIFFALLIFVKLEVNSFFVVVNLKLYEIHVSEELNLSYLTIILQKSARNE